MGLIRLAPEFHNETPEQALLLYGDIILLYDAYPTSVEAALEVIDTLIKQGYTFVTVDELLID